MYIPILETDILKPSKQTKQTQIKGDANDCTRKNTDESNLGGDEQE